MEFIPVVCHIPDLLKRLGKTQRWLAERTGISEQRISDYVHLRYPNITLKHAILIADAIGCRVEAIFTWAWRQRK